MMSRITVLLTRSQEGSGSPFQGQNVSWIIVGVVTVSMSWYTTPNPPVRSVNTSKPGSRSGAASYSVMVGQGRRRVASVGLAGCTRCTVSVPIRAVGVARCRL